VFGWAPSAGQVSLSLSVGWGDTVFYATIWCPGGTSARETVVLQANASKTKISWHLEASHQGWSGESVSVAGVEDSSVWG